MKHQVIVLKSAEKHFRKLPRTVQANIKKTFSKMESDPLGGDVVRLSGTGAFRRRVGRYRILFAISKAEIVVIILDIRKRDNRTYSDM